MADSSDSEDELNFRNNVAPQQKKMSEALDCSLATFSFLYNGTSHNNPPLPNNDVDPELAAINGGDEDWWAPSSANAVLTPKKNVSANPF